jgi:hypothetical protein
MPAPIDSTTPTGSCPRMIGNSHRIDPCDSARYIETSLPHTQQASTRMRASSSPTTGFSRCWSSSVLGPIWTIARMSVSVMDLLVVWPCPPDQP